MAGWGIEEEEGRTEYGSEDKLEEDQYSLGPNTSGGWDALRNHREAEDDRCYRCSTLSNNARFVCPMCGRTRHVCKPCSDSTLECSMCPRDFICHECMAVCGDPECGKGVCHGCVTGCSGCGSQVHTKCLFPCHNCKTRKCRACLKKCTVCSKRTCGSCRASGSDNDNVVCINCPAPATASTSSSVPTASTELSHENL